jgi:hypothetical protein
MRLIRWKTILRAFILFLPALVMADITFELDELGQVYPEYRSDIVAVVNISTQEINLYQQGEWVTNYPVSTAEKGAGNKENSYQTPLGVHFIRNKFGAGAAELSVFKSRINTQRIAQLETRPRHTGEDLVTTRILWLSGLELGINQGEGVDSYRRYIYIHGTHEEGLIGEPASHGCIRMRNSDVIDLFEQMPERALVWIKEG